MAPNPARQWHSRYRPISISIADLDDGDVGVSPYHRHPLYGGTALVALWLVALGFRTGRLLLRVAGFFGSLFGRLILFV